MLYKKVSSHKETFENNKKKIYKKTKLNNVFKQNNNIFKTAHPPIVYTNLSVLICKLCRI